VAATRAAATRSENAASRSAKRSPASLRLSMRGMTIAAPPRGAAAAPRAATAVGRSGAAPRRALALPRRAAGAVRAAAGTAFVDAAGRVHAERFASVLSARDWAGLQSLLSPLCMLDHPASDFVAKGPRAVVDAFAASFLFAPPSARLVVASVESAALAAAGGHHLALTWGVEVDGLPVPVFNTAFIKARPARGGLRGAAAAGPGRRRACGRGGRGGAASGATLAAAGPAPERASPPFLPLLLPPDRSTRRGRSFTSATTPGCLRPPLRWPAPPRR